MAVPRGTVDAATAEEFFKRQFEDPANRACCDGGAGSPEWTSTTHGIYLSIGSAGVHRSLGVGVSFVQSTSMDSWKPLHLKMMELGGNRRFSEFLRRHGVPEDLPIRQKYSTRAAQWYRENLRALAEGGVPPQPLAPGEGCLPANDALGCSDEVLDEVFACASDDDGSCGGVVHRHTRLIGRGRALVGSEGEEEDHCSGNCCKKAYRGLRCAFASAKKLADVGSGASDSSGTRCRHAGAVAGALVLGAIAAA